MISCTGSVVPLQGQFPAGTGCMMFPCKQPGSKFLLAVLDGPVAVGGIKGAFDGDKHLLFQKIVDRRVIQVADVVSLDDTQVLSATNT